MLDLGVYKLAVSLAKGSLVHVIKKLSDLCNTHTHTHTCTLSLSGGEKKSVSRILFEIVEKEGPRHLFKGLAPRLIAVPSMMSVFYVINEELEKLLLGKEFPS